MVFDFGEIYVETFYTRVQLGVIKQLMNGRNCTDGQDAKRSHNDLPLRAIFFNKICLTNNYKSLRCVQHMQQGEGHKHHCVKEFVNAGKFHGFLIVLHLVQLREIDECIQVCLLKFFFFFWLFGHDLQNPFIRN